MQKLIISAALFLSLGLDTLGVSLGLGMSGLRGPARLRIAFSFAIAEGIMPLIGFLAGQRLAQVIGDAASYVAIFLLLLLGAYTIWEAIGEGERELEVGSFWRLIVLSLSVSLDELAIGFSLGLLGIPIVLAIAYIAAQAFAVTLLGMALGGMIAQRFAERAELLAGLTLIGLAILLLVTRLAGLDF